MSTEPDSGRPTEVPDETICDYLFWVRRRLIYQALLEDNDRIDTGRCLSTQENRRAMAQILTQAETALSAVPPIWRGSMRYVAAPADASRGEGESE